MHGQSTIKPGVLKELIALLVFLFVGGTLAFPLLCPGGDVVGRHKVAFVFAAFCRLAWQVYKRTFRFGDYFVYFALVVGFCVWLDSQL